MIARAVLGACLVLAMLGPVSARAHENCEGLTIETLDEGNGVHAPGFQVNGKNCAYTAPFGVGYIAGGTWKITIVRGTATIKLENGISPACGASAVRAGDRVTVSPGTPGFVYLGDLRSAC